MSLNRYATRRDSAEGPIIQALERCGYDVWPLDYPCDLAVRKSWWGPGLFKLLEVKTGRGKRLTVAKDKRQEAQRTFIEVTKVPIVRTPEEALRVLGEIP